MKKLDKAGCNELVQNPFEKKKARTKKTEIHIVYFFLACKVQIIKQFHEKVLKRLQLKSQ